MQCSLRDNGDNWAQPLLLSIMPISDQFEDDSRRSEGFYFILCFCNRFQMLKERYYPLGKNSPRGEKLLWEIID